LNVGAVLVAFGQLGVVINFYFAFNLVLVAG
jgi:hypothetical protein